TSPYRITWFDRSGHVLRTIGEPANHIEVDLASDGRRLLVETQYQPNADLWIYDLESGTRRRITSSPFDETYPLWSPDGSRIAFSKQPQSGGSSASFYQVNVMRGDGAGTPGIVLADSGRDAVALSWSSDGSALLVGRGSFRNAGIAELWRLTLATGKSEPVLPASQLVASASCSPDGRWIAFSALTTGRPEIAVIRAPRADQPPDPDARQWSVSTGGGGKPVWRQDGRELYYQRPDGTMMAVGVGGTADALPVLY